MALDAPPSSPWSHHRKNAVDRQQQQFDASGKPAQHGQQPSVLSLSFNQDYGCFACSTKTGFRVFNCQPFGEAFRREFVSSGIGLVEMLFRSNIIALVKGSRLMIWDDNQSRCIRELTFRSAVRAVRLRRDAMVVVLEHKIYVYDFADLRLIHSLETLANPRGLCVVSYTTATSNCPSVLVCPGQRRGEVRVELYTVKKARFFQAHDSALACLGLSLDGTLLATASTKGTLIRIFNTRDCTKLQELRRGADRADIYSIAFSPSTHWLVVSSDKGTVHVFSLKASDELRAGDGSWFSGSGTLFMAGSALLSFAAANAGSSLSFMKGVLPKYFGSEWSFAQFRVPEDTYVMSAFGPERNSVVLVCTNGSFYRCSFDPVNGGEMVQQQFERFINPEDGE